MSSQLQPLTLLGILFTCSGVVGYYCNHDLCSSPEQYCCGDNLCCDYADSSWYLWILVLAIILAMSLLYGLLCVDAMERRHSLLHKFLNKLMSFIRPKVPEPLGSDSPVESSIMDLTSSTSEVPLETERCIV